MIHSGTATIDSPQMRQAIDRVSADFAGDTRFGSVIAPQPGFSISPDGHTGIVVAGANASTDDAALRPCGAISTRPTTRR